MGYGSSMISFSKKSRFDNSEIQSKMHKYQDLIMKNQQKQELIKQSKTELWASPIKPSAS
jgi:hypothetical protein